MHICFCILDNTTTHCVLFIFMLLDNRYGSLHVLPEHFLSKFYQVMGASWFVGEGVSSDAAAGRTMPLPGEPVNSVLYTNMGPVMRALAAYLRAGCHGLDEKGLVELVVKLAYSAIDVGVKISCKMATNYALSEAINAIHENAWEERSSDGSSTGVVMRRRSLICGKAFEIIEMLLAPSALDLSKEKNPFLFVELVRGLPHTVRGALLRRGFCHKVMMTIYFLFSSISMAFSTTLITYVVFV